MSDCVFIVVGTPPEQIQMVDALFTDDLALCKNVFSNAGHLLIVKLSVWSWAHLWYV
jgi:hypothetical protein